MLVEQTYLCEVVACWSDTRETRWGQHLIGEPREDAAAALPWERKAPAVASLGRGLDGRVGADRFAQPPRRTSSLRLRGAHDSGQPSQKNEPERAERAQKEPEDAMNPTVTEVSQAAGRGAEVTAGDVERKLTLRSRRSSPELRVRHRPRKRPNSAEYPTPSQAQSNVFMRLTPSALHQTSRMQRGREENSEETSHDGTTTSREDNVSTGLQSRCRWHARINIGDRLGTWHDGNTTSCDGMESAAIWQQSAAQSVQSHRVADPGMGQAPRAEEVHEIVPRPPVSQMADVILAAGPMPSSTPLRDVRTVAGSVPFRARGH